MFLLLLFTSCDPTTVRMPSLLLATPLSFDIERQAVVGCRRNILSLMITCIDGDCRDQEKKAFYVTALIGEGDRYLYISGINIKYSIQALPVSSIFDGLGQRHLTLASESEYRISGDINAILIRTDDNGLIFWTNSTSCP